MKKDKHNNDNEMPFDPEDLPEEFRDALSSGQAGLIGMDLKNLPGETRKEKLENAMGQVAGIMAATTELQEIFQSLCETSHAAVFTLRSHAMESGVEDIVKVFVDKAKTPIKTCLGIIEERVKLCKENPDMLEDDNDTEMQERIDNALGEFRDLCETYGKACNDPLVKDFMEAYASAVCNLFGKLESRCMGLLIATMSGGPKLLTVSAEEIVPKLREMYLNFTDEWNEDNDIPEQVVKEVKSARAEYQRLMDEGISHDKAVKATFGSDADRKSLAEDAFLDWVKENT